jgi:hypothetical protein
MESLLELFIHVDDFCQFIKNGLVSFFLYFNPVSQLEWAQYFPSLPYRQTCEQWPEGK